MSTNRPSIANDMQPARYFVFMGVCGVGKSTIARAVSDMINGSFIEADTLHSPQNVKAMSAGKPLDDADRWPWLEAVCDAAISREPPVVIACSALKASYRNFIRDRLPNTVFLHLSGPRDLIRRRMEDRGSHFMSPDLLDSQLEILEPLDQSPFNHVLSIEDPRNEVVNQAASICKSHLTSGSQNGHEAIQPNQS